MTATNIITTIRIDVRAKECYFKVLHFRGFVKASKLRLYTDSKTDNIVLFSNVPTEFQELVLAPSSSLVHGLSTFDVDIDYDASNEDYCAASATYDQVAEELNKFCEMM
jgi:hypothetical protein